MLQFALAMCMGIVCHHMYMYIVFHPRFWPDHIRQRVNSTYTYFATGLSVTSVAAFAATRATSVMQFMAGRPVAVSSMCPYT